MDDPNRHHGLLYAPRRKLSYQCPFACGLEFGAEHLLKKHIQNHHRTHRRVFGEVEEVPFVCGDCESSFWSEDAYMLHRAGTEEGYNADACRGIREKRRRRQLDGNDLLVEDAGRHDDQDDAFVLEALLPSNNNNAQPEDLGYEGSPHRTRLGIDVLEPVPRSNWGFSLEEATGAAEVSRQPVHGGPVLKSGEKLAAQIMGTEFQDSVRMSFLRQRRETYDDLVGVVPDPQKLVQLLKVLESREERGIAQPTAKAVREDFEAASSHVKEYSLSDECPWLKFLMIHPRLVYQKWLSLPQGSIIQDPLVEKNAKGERIYSSYVSGDHFEMVKQHAQDQFIISTMLYTDACIVVDYGDRKMHPIYMILANAAPSVSEKDRYALIGFVPIIGEEEEKKIQWRDQRSKSVFRARVLQKVIEIVVTAAGFTDRHRNGISLLFPDGKYRPVYAILAAYLGDRPELLSVCGKTVSHSSRLKRPCRMCQVSGEQLSDTSLRGYWPLHIVPEEKYDEWEKAVDSLVQRRHGTVKCNETVLQEDSRAEVNVALRKCRHFIVEASTPHCSLHTFKIGIGGRLLSWVLKLLVREEEERKRSQGRAGRNAERDSGSDDGEGDSEDECFGDENCEWIKIVNQRVAAVDEGIPELYKYVSPKGWALHPKIKTGQHKARALFALTFAMRNLRDSPERDEIYFALCLWNRISRLIFARQITSGEINSLQSLIAQFRVVAKRAFKDESFDFPMQHDLLHFPLNILRYGCAFEFTTDTMEKLHGIIVKRLFRFTKRADHDSTALLILQKFVFQYVTAPVKPRLLSASQGFRIGLIGDGVKTTFGQALASRADACRSPTRPNLCWDRLLRLWDEKTRLVGSVGCSDEQVRRRSLRTYFQMHLYPGKIVADPSFYSKFRIDSVVGKGTWNGGILTMERYFLVLLIFEGLDDDDDHGSRENLFCQELDIVDAVCPVMVLPRVRTSERYCLLNPADATGFGVWRAIPCLGDRDGISGEWAMEYMLMPNNN